MNFSNGADEPATVQRSITITVDSLQDMRSCGLMVYLVLINDNPPVVDLSGPLQPSVNRTTSLSFDFINGASVPIAAQDAAITDLDADGRIERLEAILTPIFEYDGIYLSESTACDNFSSTCHLRLVHV